ncbi:MAG TPA: glycosyltransferase [Nitrospira sp.]|nr:glycosyltransferase [Nitrospira sp.]
MKVGIFDHLSLRLGGGQLVVAHMAAQLSKVYDVELIHSGRGYSKSGLAEAFDVDLTAVTERIVHDAMGSFCPPGLSLAYICRTPRFDRTLTEPYDLFIYSGHGVPPFCSAKRGLIYCHFPIESHPMYDLPCVDGWNNHGRVNRWARLQGYKWVWNRRMRGYQTVLGNSQFTSGWIERRWKRSSEVLYPPVAVLPVSAAKENIIVSLGRFIVTDQKNHALQLRAFRRFQSTAGQKWRLCLIGFCTDLPEDRAYLEELRTMSRDMDVTFVLNAPRPTLWSYLAKAKLYWHAMALGDGNTLPPERMEHFGIATVEAMGAGCVPLVPRSGGQLEIVEHGISGFCCGDIDELMKHTERVAGDESLRRQMAQAAAERSASFRPERFNRRLNQLVPESARGLDRADPKGCNASDCRSFDHATREMK